MSTVSNLNATVRQSKVVEPDNTKYCHIVTVFDGIDKPQSYDLDSFKKDIVLFGRSDDNDIQLKSGLVSRTHDSQHRGGLFIKKNSRWYIQDDHNTNGILFNDIYINRQELAEGSLFRIDSLDGTREDGVLFIGSKNLDNAWQMYPLHTKEVTIGRNTGCDLCLNHVTVSNVHAILTKEPDGWYIQDHNSTNGLLINGIQYRSKIALHEKDVITITNTTIIYVSQMLFFYTGTNGVSIEARDIVVKRKVRHKPGKYFIASDHINMSINPGELVSIIGGSGAGKSTIMNVLCGYLKPSEGVVYINGCNLYQNFDAVKSLFGYVPQSDIVYSKLSIYDMLKYTSRLRLPKDISAEERDKAITNALQTVDLLEHKDKLIQNLSGGQRKRASIAVELLADPQLLFLDEPVSGLDPGTERDLMQSLRKMADMGKTIILVTHSTLQLGMCDKVAFVGKGGKLCYLGALSDALDFFGVNDVVDIYQEMTYRASKWEDLYKETEAGQKNSPVESKPPVRQKRRVWQQFVVLCQRYIKLMINDKIRLAILLLQAPLLGYLISVVANGEQFTQFDSTRNLLFVLSCSGIWMGLFTAGQEICKERSILKREYMSGLSPFSYVMSKIAVIGLITFIQSILVLAVFIWRVGIPEEGVMMSPLVEMFINTWLTELACAAMGLLVSALVSSPSAATGVVPILLLPQLLFSGMLFKLSGITEYLSWLTVCRWSMEGYGTISNLNSMETALQQQGFAIPHKAEDFYELTAEHLLSDWGYLIALMVFFLIMAILALPRLKKAND